jgi:chitinase
VVHSPLIICCSFTPAELPYADLTHIFYAFADVNPTNGTVFLVDPWADEQTPFDSPAPEDELRGNFGRLLRAKREHRTTKVSISVGGWTFKDHFAPVACDAKKRAEFVRSALTLLEDYGLDGIDIDWEYPENGKEASDFVLLLREMRAGLDAHAAYKGEPRYLLTIASPAGEKKLKLLRVREMDGEPGGVSTALPSVLTLRRGA